MDANKAVEYQNPAHAHSGTPEDTFTVASGAADKTRLTRTGVERVGETADLPLELAARGKGAVNALGGSMVVGPYNMASGGYLPRPYTADPVGNPWTLIIEGGDFTAEFPGSHVSFTDGDRFRCCEGWPSYNAGLNRTEIFLMWDNVYSTSGVVVCDSANGLVAGFGNIIAGSSAALGQLCVSVGRCSFAAGLFVRAFGDQSFAAGNYCHAFGAFSVAVGYANAAGYGSCAFGYGMIGWWPDWVESIVDGTVTLSGDARSRFAQWDGVLLFNSRGQRLETTIASPPVYENGKTAFDVFDQPTFTAEQIVDTSIGQFAFAEGSSHAIGEYAHAEGASTLASGAFSHSEGYLTVSSGESAHAEGGYTTASAQYAHTEGYYTSASAKASHAGGYYAAANKQFQRALASGRFANAGDSQFTEIILRRVTGNATPAELTIDGTAPSGTTEETSNRFICAAGKTYACLIMITARKSDGTSAFFLRQALVKNVGGAVSLEGAVQTVGVDINPAGWSVAITADNTNKSLVIMVTGAASTTIRWSANIQAQEIKF